MAGGSKSIAAIVSLSGYYGDLLPGNCKLSLCLLGQGGSCILLEL